MENWQGTIENGELRIMNFRKNLNIAVHSKLVNPHQHKRFSDPV